MPQNYLRNLSHKIRHFTVKCDLSSENTRNGLFGILKLIETQKPTPSVSSTQMSLEYMRRFYVDLAILQHIDFCQKPNFSTHQALGQYLLEH